jgi:hypothetical protein
LYKDTERKEKDLVEEQIVEERKGKKKDKRK